MRSFSINSMPVSFLKQTRREWALVALAGVAEAAKVLRVGGIAFDVVRGGRGKNRYLHVHGNETTAREVLREHMGRVRGEAYLIQSDRRNVKVGECWIDPNRMFSREGAEKSMVRWNKDQDRAVIEAALGMLDKDRERFLRAVLPGKGARMIAMHNNGEGYSIQDEIPISDAVWMPDERNPGDFMLLTDEKDFAAVKAGKFNAVLQKTVRVQDGSFSVVAIERGVRYVNIEAALGNKEKQRAMVEYLEGVLG
jgi:hypothetical protein